MQITYVIHVSAHFKKCLPAEEETRKTERVFKLLITLS